MDGHCGTQFPGEGWGPVATSLDWDLTFAGELR